MKINFLVRAKNKMFWLAFIPAALLLLQTLGAAFGLDIDVSGISAKLLDLVNAAFAVLAILGVVADPTTEGMGDSDRAMQYEEPN